jgi:glycosyltransferase involved in cell wall biosynthesis
LRILFIAPLPPPVTGHSLVCRVLLDDLERDNEMVVVNFNKNSFSEGANSLGRFFEVARVLAHIWKGQRGVDAIYLTISESMLGNLKDVLTYMLCLPNLRRMYIHLHGGSIKRLLWDHHPWLRRLNAFFIRRLGGVIISGESHLPIFEGMIDRDRIHIMPNFAQEYLFASEAEIAGKFAQTSPLRIAYVSNFIPHKGYADLLDAFFTLDESVRRQVRIDFAGHFDSPAREHAFLERIAGAPELSYRGSVDAARKRELFVQSHVFCLPTAMFEGQPISILEGYAAGCVVITTGQSGILDIFADGANGIQIEPSSPASIAAAITRLVAMNSELGNIALSNNRTARKKYRAEIYNSRIRSILHEQAPVLAGAR